MNIIDGRLLSEEGLILSEVVDPSVLERIYALRVDAWRETISVAPQITRWTDEVDATARHWAVKLGDRVVAAARLSVHPTVAEVPHAEIYSGVVEYLEPLIGSLNRCVVHPEFRGKSLSEVLDRSRIDAAKARGCRSVIMSAPDPRRAAKMISEGFGFRGEGPRTPSGFLKGNQNLVFVLDL